MQCVVLAGGLGTRMRPFTLDFPKALIPVLGRPFAELQLEWLAGQGVTDVVYSIGYRGDMIRGALGDGASLGVRIRYVDEGEHLAGTAGALRLALEAGVLGSAFFVLYGDSYLTVDLPAVWASFTAQARPALMTVFRNDGQWDRSNVVFDGQRVVRYDKVAQPSPDLVYIDYGLSVVSRHVVEEIPPATVSDLADLYRCLSSQGRLAGFEVSNRFYEVGSEVGLHALESHLRSRRLSEASPGSFAG